MEELKRISKDFREQFYKTGIPEYFLMAQLIDKLVINIEKENTLENKQEESLSL